MNSIFKMSMSFKMSLSHCCRESHCCMSHILLLFCKNQILFCFVRCKSMTNFDKLYKKYVKTVTFCMKTFAVTKLGYISH